MEAEKYFLKLFIKGNDVVSTKAINSVQLFCENHLHGKYLLDIIDVDENPEAALIYEINSFPALIKECPKPFVKLSGELTDYEKLLVGILSIEPQFISE